MQTDPTTTKGLKIREIFNSASNKWLTQEPSETVRQEFVITLVNSYGFSLDQIAVELRDMGHI